MPRKRVNRSSGLCVKAKKGRYVSKSSRTVVDEDAHNSKIVSATNQEQFERRVMSEANALGTQYNMNDWKIQERCCLAIHHLYTDVMDCPFELECDGDGGTMALICHKLDLGLHQRKSVKDTLKSIVEYHSMGLEYDGTRRTKCGQGGKPLLIPAGSVEMQIIADSLEAGYGLRQTKVLVNEHRCQSDDKVMAGLSTIYEAYKRLKAVITKIKGENKVQMMRTQLGVKHVMSGPLNHACNLAL
jgi:hypothetical protein